MCWRALALGLWLSACAASDPAAARAYTVDDLLKQESFGDVALDPTGRYAVVERRGPYDSAAGFDQQHRNPLGASRLLLSDLAADPTGRPLMPQPPGYGYLAGPWSPDGRRIAVFRLARGSWELGVASPATGDVTWLGATPASAAMGRSVQWASSQALLVLARPADDPPLELRLGSQSARRLPPRWAAAAAGEAAYTLLGSGAHAQATPKPAPSQLLRFDLEGGARETLATGRFTDLELSSNGRQLALLEVGDRLQSSPERPPQGAWGTGAEAMHLAVLDLATRNVVRPCGACDVLDTLLSWSPSGRRLLVFVRPPDAAWTEGAFHLFDGDTGRLSALDRTRVSPSFRFRPEAVETGWLGERPIVRGRSRAANGDRTDWWTLSAGRARNLTSALPVEPGETLSGARELMVVAGRRLWRISGTGAARLAGPSEVEPLPEAWIPGRSRLGHVAPSDPAKVLLGTMDGRLRVGDGQSIPINVSAGDVVLGYSAPRKGLVTRSTSPQGVGRLELRRPGRAPAVISEVNAGLKDIDALRVVPIHHPGPRGETLTSWLYLPSGGASGDPPPLIVRPYLGETYPTPPAAKPPILNFVIDVRILVGRGYAVLLPSLPLPMTDREPLSGIGGRVVGIIDAAAQQARGAFDPERLGIWGHSYGGYTTLGVIGQTDRFKAAIAMNAPTDLISHYGDFQPNWRVSPEDGVWTNYTAGFLENSQGRMGAPPWRASDRYIRNSPLFQVEAIHTPVLMFHGDQDPIGVTQSEEMFSALHRLRKDAVLVTYWGEGHLISSPGNVRDLYARAFRWLDRYLKPEL